MSNGEDLYVVDWHSLDIADEDDTSSSSNEDGQKTFECQNKFVVKAFCIDTQGHTVVLNIHDFNPYYYVKVPNDWTIMQANMCAKGLKGKVKKWHSNTLIDWKLINAKPLYGFTANDKFRYLRLTFTCLAGFYAFRKVLTEPLRLFGLNENRSYRYELYESNLHPLLRFMHCNNLQAVGWLNVKEPRAHFQNTTTCKRELSTSVQAITPIVREDIPPIKYMGFDIEADSSHGDFPLANKDYQKLARDIITDYCLVRDERLYSDMRPILATYLKYAFHPYYNNNNIRSVKLLEQKYPSVAEILSIVPFETVSGLNQIIEHWLPRIAQILQSAEEDQVTEIMDILEFNFPAIDIETSDYYSCSAQLVKEYKRLCSINDEVHQAQPIKVTKTLMEMMFDPYYNNLNINHIYNKRGRLPALNMCKNLVPSIYTICEKAYAIIQADRKYIRHRKMGVKKKKDNTEGAIKVDDCVQELREIFNKYLPEVQDDRVIQIGSTIKKYGETDCYMKHIICLNDTEDIANKTLIDFEYSGVELPKEELLRDKTRTSGPGADLKELNNTILTERREKQYKTDQAKVIVECYDTEEEVLLAWARLVSQEDPDIVVGYNTFGFDYKYLYDRAEQLGILDEFSQLGRIKGVSQQLIEKKLQSAGLGDNLLYIIEMHGRISIDLYKVIQKMYQLNSYKLDSVCKQFLYKAKVDVSPAEIFVRQKGSAADRRIVAEYCLIDCILCIRLMDKMELIINNIGMAQVCSVPLSFLFLRGQGIKLFSFVAKICREKGNLIAVLDEPEDEGKYEGAIVLEPDKGIHNEAVVVADFNSLYPSCMISENLSHNSFVGYKIVKKGANTDYRGQCLTNNKYERNLVAGLYPGWDYADIVYDMYKEVPVAAGRKKIQKVVSGHKICRFAQPPNGEKDIIPTILMDLLSARKKVRSEQENHAEGSFKYNIAEGLQLAYKVTANSLYGIIGASTSPIRCREIAACTTAVGRKLIHFSAKYVTDNYPGSEITYGDSVASYTPILINQDGVTKIIKIEDLSHGYSEPKPGSDKEVADLRGMNIMSWTESGWTKINCVIRHKLASTKKMFRVLTHTGLVDVTSDHSLLRPDGTEVSPIELKIGDELLHHAYPSMGSDLSSYSVVEARIKGYIIGLGTASGSDFGSGSPSLMEIPDEILNGSHAIREAFWDEFSSANNGRVNQNQVLCAQLSLLADSLGISLDESEKGDAITGLHELEYNGYVYDLTTTNHHFQAGIGKIIVHNTDSIFCKFVCKDRYGEPLHGLDAINKSILLCTEASMLISKQLKKPHNLEFEKAILPFILLSKKRYHGHYYKNYGSSKFSAKSMGIVLKRRDNAPIVKHIFGKMIDIIMEEQSIDKALEFVKTECEKVLRGEFPLEMFIIAKTLRSYYKKPDSIAHNVLAQRIGKRDPGNKPRGNDRIAYAFIVNPNAVLQGDMIETPEYIIKHGCKIDYGYYITHQVAKPVLQIFELAKRGDKLFDDLLREHYSIGWKKITDYDSIKIYTAADFKIRNLWNKKSNTDDIFGDETAEEDETDTEEEMTL